MNATKTTELQAEFRKKFTGRKLIQVSESASAKSIDRYSKNASIKLASFSDYKSNPNEYTKAFNEADGILFEAFGIAVVNENRQKEVNRLTTYARSKTTFIYSEPERYVYALPFRPSIEKKMGTKRKKASFSNTTFEDTSKMTWGLHALQIPNSVYTGKGISIAILDTGFFLKHPDFSGRSIITKSFITNENVNDLNGHGTHCAGIAAGGVMKNKKRYGVAPEANLFIGKVLSNKGEGSDSTILAGMEWAILNNCKIISMSLGSQVEEGENYSMIYNSFAQKALNRGCLIIAAAGNESDRELGKIIPVGHPANCPGIMAVGALDQHLQVANFSCGGLVEAGGQVDIAAPGVDIYSSWKSPKLYQLQDGTSMATPYVAGVAALLWEANPKASAAEIWMLLTQGAKRLNVNASDIGAGIVQAP